jgi:hypothetical protein
MRTSDENSFGEGKPIKLRQGQPVKFTTISGDVVTLTPGKGVTRAPARVKGAAKIEHANLREKLQQ